MIHNIKNYLRIRKFTLLELLIVIAIISILAALLLPSLNKARASSRKIKCTSNIRQIELGALMYFTDTHYHATYWTGTSNAWGWSGHCLNDYLPDVTPANATVLKTGVRSKYACPDIDVNSALDTRTIGCNTLSFGAANTLTKPSMAANLRRWLSSGKIKKPSEICHFADSSGLNPAALGGDSITYRHLGTANVSYLDGHAGSVKRIPTATEYDTTQAFKAFWGSYEPL